MALEKNPLYPVLFFSFVIISIGIGSALVFAESSTLPTAPNENSVLGWMTLLNAKILSSSQNYSTPIPSPPTTPPIPPSTPSSKETSIVFSESNISAACINKVLAEKNSPATGTGDAFYAYGKQYDINPAFALALFRQENSLCNPAAESTATAIGCKNKSIGNIICTTANCYKNFNTYATWEEGIRASYDLLRNGTYYIKAGKTTIESIYPVWANVPVTPQAYETTQLIKYFNEYNTKTC